MVGAPEKEQLGGESLRGMEDLRRHRNKVWDPR